MDSSGTRNIRVTSFRRLFLSMHMAKENTSNTKIMAFLSRYSFSGKTEIKGGEESDELVKLCPSCFSRSSTVDIILKLLSRKLSFVLSG